MASGNDSQLVDAVRKKDYSAQLLARRAGASAVPMLVPLLDHADEEVRELAVYCLGETGLANAGEPLVRALLDPDPQVAMGAARALRSVATPSLVPALLGAFERVQEPLVRREISLTVGRLANREETPILRTLLAGETAPEALQGLIAALARLGVQEDQFAFMEALRTSTGDERREWLELADYISQAWLLRPLTELLEDTTLVLRVGVDAHPNLIDALRVCDLALNLIAQISGAKFSFPVTRAKNYSPAECAEVRRVAGRS